MRESEVRTTSVPTDDAGAKAEIDETPKMGVSELPLKVTPVVNETQKPPQCAAAEQETRMQDTDEPIPDTLRRFPTVAALDELERVLDVLGGDEIAVLVRIARRLAMGRKSYGPLQVERDPRAFRSKEAREELEDALVYLACAWLKAETAQVSP
jgi:hypothetical protein